MLTWDGDAQAQDWSRNLKPVSDILVQGYVKFLPKQTYPIRCGVHPNTAFGMMFALDYARTVGNKELAAVLEERSRTYYGKDEKVPAAWEPDGADFFA